MKSEGEYAPLPSFPHEVHYDPTQGCNCRDRHRTSSQRWRHAALVSVLFAAWTIASLGFGCFLSRQSLPLPFKHIDFHRDTELGSALSSIETQKVTFTGAPIFDENGTASLPSIEGQPRYVGAGGQEIEDNWHELISLGYFYISEDEAESLWGSEKNQYWNNEHGYLIELEVFHTLHCVNILRKTIYEHIFANDETNSKATKSFERYHIDHCIDIVRQSIQCHGDMTPIPTRYWDGLGGNFIDSNQRHTCRNFEKLHAFSIERHMDAPYVFQTHHHDR